jgi:23S rRNA pseudouridine1911/1915/1917 synthase
MRTRNLPAPEILLERGAVIVVNKPGGLLTQGPPGIDSLELRVKQFLIERENKPGKAYLGVPHRLDRPVSGVMVVVKNVRAAKRISEQIKNRNVVKKYWAVVTGIVGQLGDTGTWHDWMRKIPEQAKSELVEMDHPDAREAILEFTVLARTKIGQRDFSLVEINLHTGRTHQIRLQASSRGFPIIGDSLYESSHAFGPQELDLRKRWIGLHARFLAFEHPIDKQPVNQLCPLPEHWIGDPIVSDLLSTIEGLGETT